MDKIEWGVEYSVGHPEMDTQHQIIIGAINQCTDLLEQGGADQEIIEPILQTLGRYATDHFSHEESLLESVNFSGVETQRSEHEVYSMKVALYQEREFTQKNLADLVKFLNFWWMHHILVEDMQYKGLFEGG